MLKTIGAIALAAVAVAGTMQPASARNGGAVAAGVGAGLVAGAIIGSAASQRSYYSGPAYADPYYQPVYTNCRTTREWDGFRWRRVRVCD